MVHARETWYLYPWEAGSIAQLNAIFFTQRSCVLDNMYKNDTQGIEYFVLLGILLHLVMNFVLFILVQFVTTIHHHLSGILF